MWDGRAREHRGGSPDAFQDTVLLPLPEMQQLSDINRVRKNKRKYSSLAKSVNFSSAKRQHCASENCLSLQQGGEREIKMK